MRENEPRGVGAALAAITCDRDTAAAAYADASSVVAWVTVRARSPSFVFVRSLARSLALSSPMAAFRTLGKEGRKEEARSFARSLVRLPLARSLVLRRSCSDWSEPSWKPIVVLGAVNRREDLPPRPTDRQLF